MGYKDKDLKGKIYPLYTRPGYRERSTLFGIKNVVVSRAASHITRSIWIMSARERAIFLFYFIAWNWSRNWIRCRSRIRRVLHPDGGLILGIGARPRPRPGRALVGLAGRRRPISISSGLDGGGAVVALGCLAREKEREREIKAFALLSRFPARSRYTYTGRCVHFGQLME